MLDFRLMRSRARRVVARRAITARSKESTFSLNYGNIQTCASAPVSKASPVTMRFNLSPVAFVLIPKSSKIFPENLEPTGFEPVTSSMPLRRSTN
jgi:hypothetical protein